jgi:hypothetical protein
MTLFTGAAALTITAAFAESDTRPRSTGATLTATATPAGTAVRGALGDTELTATETPAATGAHRGIGTANLTVAAAAAETDVQHRSSGNAHLTITAFAAESHTTIGPFIGGVARMTPTIRYPAGPITPAGGYHILSNRVPTVAYRSYDDTAVFNLMGGLSIADPTMPERVELTDIKGLIPPWQDIEQKGATQDGSTYVTSLYDPIDVDLTVVCRGRDPAHTRQVVRDWIAAWDAKQQGELSWFTHELGRWWAPMRWAKNPVDPMTPIQQNRQKFMWTAKSFGGFWRSYDSTDVFAYSYLSATDLFTVDTSGAHNLGANWTIHYNGVGAGYLYADGTEALSTLANGAYAVAQRTGFVSASDEQIVTITIGPIDNWPAATDTYLDIWARMANADTPGQTGVRLRIGYQQGGTGKGASTTPFVRLSYFVAGVETLLRETTVTVPWMPTDQISLATGGFSGAVNSYYVQRGTNTTAAPHNVTWQTLMTVVHTTGDGSLLGAAYRGAGFGMEADGIQQPASIVCWTAGDSTAAEEAGYLTLYNAGDQDMWPFFILVGPGIFGLGDGPNATSAVTYGPLEENQIVFIRTDPRRYAVTDLTSMPPPGTPSTNQFISQLASALADFNSFISNGAPAPNLSVFGTPFPQGNPYSLLNGRFSRPIPAKPVGAPPPPQQIAVAVESGGPTTAILAGGTPLRRYPT